jgi:hypothetical protein
MLRRFGPSSITTKPRATVASYVAKSFFANRRPCLSLLATKNYSKIPTHIARSFYINPSDRSNCDCRACKEAVKGPICHICKVQPSTSQTHLYHSDHRGGYRLTLFCDSCWKAHVEEKEKAEQERRQALALRMAKAEKMLEHVRGINSTEQVYIAYAIDRFMNDIKSVSEKDYRGHKLKDYINLKDSRHLYRWYLFQHLSLELGIVKVGNRYRCDKGRVDAMDFKQWYFRYWLDVDI